MFGKRLWLGLVPVWMVLAFVGGFFVRASASGEMQEPPPVTFTYQGQLQEDGQLAEGSYDFRFRLYSAGEGGDPLGEVIQPAVSVNQGRFSVMLTFTREALSAGPGYLEIAVRPGGSNIDFTPLSPRQALTRVPYAWQADQALVADRATTAAWAEAVPWGGIGGKPTGLEDGDDNTTYSAGSGLTLDGTTFALDTTFLDGRYWRLSGNELSSEGAKIGSTNAQSWGLMVNSVEVLVLSSDGGEQATVNFTRNAGGERTIEIGERYRDNGIVAWGQVWDGEEGIELTGDFGVLSVSRTNDSNGYQVVLDVSATQDSSVFVVTVTPIFDSSMALTANVSQITVNQDGNPEFDVYIRDGSGNYVTSFCGFNFIVTGR